MPFEIVRNDIVNMKVDVIVNSANPRPIIGSGIDKAIYDKAGKELFIERQKIGNINYGEARISKGYLLDAKYVIHAVGPIWIDGKHNEKELLSSCYKNSLILAKNNNCKSIAFPLISTGNYGFPKSLALKIAINEISEFLINNEMNIYLVVFTKEEFVLSEKLFKSVSNFIDENYVNSKLIEEYIINDEENNYECRYDNIRVKLNKIDYIKEEKDELNYLLKNLDASFSETLLNLIDKSGKTDPEIYKKANIDRKLFSKIKNKKDYRPSKTTAIALSFALELNLNKTKEFIAKAGYALSHSNKFDIIVEYFLMNKNYNLYEINEVLFAFDQPLIG